MNNAKIPEIDCSAQTDCNHDYVFTLMDSGEELKKDIELPEITAAMAEAPLKKAAGPDRISNDLLKSTLGITFSFLILLFNFCFRRAVCPTACKTAFLESLYKQKGIRKDPANNRGIALLSWVYKCFTTILYEQLNNWAECFLILLEEHHGFSKKRSTITESLFTAVKSCVEMTVRCYVCFVGFEKAFDSVNRPRLFQN